MQTKTTALSPGRFRAFQEEQKMLKIDAANCIIINGRDTGLCLTQASERTIIYTPERLLQKQAYKEHVMPHNRYSAAHDNPASGVAGRSQLEADIMAMIPVKMGNFSEMLVKTKEKIAGADVFESAEWSGKNER